MWDPLHKIHNYHWYTQFQMATKEISDISSDIDDDVECIDTKPDGYDSEEGSQESDSESKSDEEGSSQSEEEDSN